MPAGFEFYYQATVFLRTPDGSGWEAFAVHPHDVHLLDAVTLSKDGSTLFWMPREPFDHTAIEDFPIHDSVVQ